MKKTLLTALVMVALAALAASVFFRPSTKNTTTMTIGRNKPETWEKIACLNWAEDFPYAPEVRFRMWHSGDMLHIEYAVDEATTKAEQNEPGGPVYMDSCVECFIQPDAADPHYYNFEWNAAGHLAMARRTGRQDPVDAPLDVIGSVSAVPSLGSEPFAECEAGPWTLEVAIPVSAFFGDSIESLAGRSMKMNLFKCGDGLKTPHFLTWQPVDTPKPDYHRPEFFVTVNFSD